MKLKEFLEVFESWEGAEREQLRNIVEDVLSPVSQRTLLVQQHNWDFDSMSYDDYVKAQNKAIRTCIKLELSGLGVAVREQLGLKPLTLETEMTRECNE